MFAEHCPRHGTRVLLPPSRIVAIHNTPTGVVVTWRCWCGHVGRTDHRTDQVAAAGRPERRAARATEPAERVPTNAATGGSAASTTSDRDDVTAALTSLSPAC
ncbi:MAG TPA: hypothetical protein VIL36_15155 [Acidimicrobiales bacterium]